MGRLLIFFVSTYIFFLPRQTQFFVLTLFLLAATFGSRLLLKLQTVWTQTV